MPRRFRRSLLIVVGVFSAIALAPRRAHAYAWMIGHGYAGCAVCHLDPSGAGLLNEFGREEAADTLRSRYGSDPPPVEPFFGLWKNPDWLLTGGSFRDGIFFMKAGAAPYSQQNILMQADLRVGIDAGRWRAAGSLGVLPNGDFPAAVVTSTGGPSLVAREYWVGYTFENDAILLRAGRINVPYGIRSIEHTLFVRVATQTDINDTQEHGVALAFRGSGFRGELMAIAGNYQESPDAYRQRGYSGYLEWSPQSHYAFGVNSLVTYAKQDVSFGVANLRQAHGLTVRASPVERLVLLGEADYVEKACRASRTGMAWRRCSRRTTSLGKGYISLARARPTARGSPVPTPPGACGGAWRGSSTPTSTFGSTTSIRVSPRLPPRGAFHSRHTWSSSISSCEAVHADQIAVYVTDGWVGRPLLTILPASAGAVSRFPGNMVDYFTPHLGYTPPCRLCHIDGTTGSGSVQTPFGISMLAHGLTSGQSTSRPRSWPSKADGVDSDGDGVRTSTSSS